MGTVMTRTDLEQLVSETLPYLGEDENAWFTLVNAPHAIVPILSEAFRAETDAARRAAILETIWQHRMAASIPLLKQALFDPSPLVWDQALDGLLTIAGRESARAIRSAYTRTFESETDQARFHEALAEALDQLGFGDQA